VAISGGKSGEDNPNLNKPSSAGAAK